MSARHPYVRAEYVGELGLIEELSLVGEADRSPACEDCGRRVFLVSGRCEPCTNEHNQALIRAEALQVTFFGTEVIA
jgi:hypothetical protein